MEFFASIIVMPKLASAIAPEVIGTSFHCIKIAFESTHYFGGYVGKRSPNSIIPPVLMGVIMSVIAMIFVELLGNKGLIRQVT